MSHYFRVFIFINSFIFPPFACTRNTVLTDAKNIVTLTKNGVCSSTKICWRKMTFDISYMAMSQALIASRNLCHMPMCMWHPLSSKVLRSRSAIYVWYPRAITLYCKESSTRSRRAACSKPKYCNEELQRNTAKVGRIWVLTRDSELGHYTTSRTQ